MKCPRALLALPLLLLGLLEDAPQDDMELNLSMLGTGEAGDSALQMLPALKEAALAVIACSIVAEAADKDALLGRGPSGACGTSLTCAFDL